MFSTIFGVIKSIFSSSSVVEAASKGIDKAIFTDQEKKELHLKSLPLYQPFQVAQRVVAFALIGIYCISYLLYLTLSSFDLPVSYRILDAVNQFNLQTIVLTIVGFYFGGGALNSLRKAGK